MNLILGDCLTELAGIPNDWVHSVVTDPPYGLAFMGKRWDYNVPSVDVWREVLRVLRPGGHLLSFGGTRTYHRMVVAIEDAGFEIRDQIQWIYGSGFPKSLDISKAIDKAAGVKRTSFSIDEDFLRRNPGKKRDGIDRTKEYSGTEFKEGLDAAKRFDPATPDAKQWEGWGTALKPANEPIALARKPLSEKTVAANVMKWGTGGINVDGSRIEASDQAQLEKNWDRTAPCGFRDGEHTLYGKGELKEGMQDYKPQGRFPANVIFDEEAGEMLDEQSGTLKAGVAVRHRSDGKNCHSSAEKPPMADLGYGDSGGASRFFYVAKASKRERNAGLYSYERIDITTGQCKDVNTVAAQLLQRVISESTAKWLTAECGLRITVSFPKECKSIIETKIRQTIELKTLNSLIALLTKEYILDVCSNEALGLSLAESADSLRVFLLTITKGEMELARGAANAALKTLQSISESDVKPYVNSHATVKPVTLMEYLCRLITPPNGTILDPFMGSGTTGLAAKNLGFHFIGIEREKEYFEIATRRIGK